MELASPANRSPSVGLAVVDSMAGCRIKAFASHAQAFRQPAASTLAPAKITRFRHVSAENPAAGRTGGSPPPPAGACALPVSYERRSARAPMAPAAGREKTARKSRQRQSG